VQVREAALEKAQALRADLVSVQTVEYPNTLVDEDHKIALLEELAAQELDALIAGALPVALVREIPQFGIPLIILGPTKIRHPLLLSTHGHFELAEASGHYLARRLHQRGRVVSVGGMVDVGWQDDGSERAAGIAAAMRNYPKIDHIHLPSLWSYNYDLVYAHFVDALKRIDGPIDAIFGLSDGLALAARNASRALGLSTQETLIMGVGGTPLALAEIINGAMSATMEIRSDILGVEAVESAYQIAHRLRRQQRISTDPVPLPMLQIQTRLVTAKNVGKIAASKLVSIANLPSRLVGDRQRQQQERLTQLETSSAISRHVGTLLDYRQLSHEIADLIRVNYGYDHVQIFHWVAGDACLVREAPVGDDGERLTAPLTEAGILQQAFLNNRAVFIPDTQHSLRFEPDPDWPDTRSRAVLPIHLGERTLGLLDLHSHRTLPRANQELIGLQALADQLGIAMHNAALYGQAVSAQAVAEQADRLKTRLLANVSHELRTPLAVILHTMEILLTPQATADFDLPEALRSHLTHVQQSAEHQLRLINDLLDLSRAEIGELNLVFEMIDLHALLEGVFRTLADSQIRRPAVIWRLELPERLPLLRADPTRIRQILINLLGNAQKFTEQGQITLGCKVAPPHVHVWVSDTGAGIPVVQQEHIFEPFATVERRSHHNEGVGLGLSITRHLVALHSGALTLESQPGKGSTFHVYLPLPNLGEQPTHAGRLTPDSVILLVSARDEIPAEVLAFSQRQQLMIRRLDGQLAGGADVRRLLGAVQPAAIAWDITLASPAEWALIEQLRSHAPISHVPFLLYTHSQDDPSLRDVSLTNLLLKPVSVANLAQAMQALQPPSATGVILIVDDDPHARDLYAAIVRETLPGYAVVIAEDGQAALAAMRHAVPSLVVLDLAMPLLDGFGVLDWMRTRMPTRSVPVLILSGRLLTVADIQRIEPYARVTVHTKGILTADETAAAVTRVLGEAEPLHTQTSALVKRALAFLHQNYQRSLTRAEIAQAVGASEDYMGRIFRAEMGLSPWQYLNRCRIERAKLLLRQSTASITAVALEVGFNDPAYFSRAFQKEAGLSPTAYRAQ